MFRIPLNNNFVGKKALFLDKLSRVCIIVIVTRINEFKKNNYFFTLYYLTVLVYTRTTSFKDLILLNMLFESEIDENVTAKRTQIALIWQ